MRPVGSPSITSTDGIGAAFRRAHGRPGQAIRSAFTSRLWDRTAEQEGWGRRVGVRRLGSDDDLDVFADELEQVEPADEPDIPPA